VTVDHVTRYMSSYYLSISKIVGVNCSYGSRVWTLIFGHDDVNITHALEPRVFVYGKGYNFKGIRNILYRRPNL